MKITICDVNKDLVAECIARGMDAVCGDIFTLEADCVVSPANSFGFMDGGIDLAYSNYFGWHVQDSVQEKIREIFDGELLVGQALTVPTSNERYPNLISAPTMRIPAIIQDPNHIRLATKAAVKQAVSNGFDSVVLPGMGTGCGMVKPLWAASMMAAGVGDAMNGVTFPKSLNDAVVSHYSAYPKMGTE